MSAFGDFSLFKGFNHGRGLADASTEGSFQVDFLNGGCFSRFGFRRDGLREFFREGQRSSK